MIACGRCHLEAVELVGLSFVTEVYVPEQHHDKDGDNNQEDGTDCSGNVHPAGESLTGGNEQCCAGQPSCSAWVSRYSGSIGQSTSSNTIAGTPLEAALIRQSTDNFLSLDK